MTDEQKNYEKLAQSGKLGDILEIIKQDIGKKGEQAFCSVNNGFLAHGRPVVPTKENGILLKSRDRCLYFGTDPMVGMLEWLGREVSKEALNLRVVVGDISGPRGGCLFGRSGKRGHASHTSGQDADIGFLSVNSGDQTRFDHHFDAVKNWWFLKKIFKNPIACVKVAFLDRRLIRLLTLAAKHDPEWSTLRRFIRHIPGHKNHLHIRVGKGPGEAGCGPDARPELEVEEDDDSSDIFGEELDASILDELKSRQGASIQE